MKGTSFEGASISSGPTQYKYKLEYVLFVVNIMYNKVYSIPINMMMMMYI